MLSAFFLPLFLLTCFLSSTFACTVTDDAGNLVSLTQPATRIISLAPDLTELVFAVGAGKSLVGVIAGSDYPVEAQKIRRVGAYYALDMETILALHPDLILVWGESQAQQVERLKKLALPVFVSHTQHLLDIPRMMERLGCLTGKEAEAARRAKNFLSRYEHLRQKYHRPSGRTSPVRVFYELSSQPLMTINQHSWINDALALCGGVNIFAHAGFKQTAFAVSAEAVLKAQPEAIIADLPPGWQKQWQAWLSNAAVKKQRLLAIDPDLMDRAGPRILGGVEQLCRAVVSV